MLNTEGRQKVKLTVTTNSQEVPRDPPETHQVPYGQLADTHLFCLLTMPADLVTPITAFCVFFFFCTEATPALSRVILSFTGGLPRFVTEPAG